jgi:hypothetical protein
MPSSYRPSGAVCHHGRTAVGAVEAWSSPGWGGQGVRSEAVMSVTALTLRHPVGSPWPFGRPFVSRLFDLAFIGGGLSLVAGILASMGGLRFGMADLSLVLLFGNFAHFASSTVRLYSKPDALRTLPRSLTVWLPLATLALFTWVLLYADWLVRYVFAVFVIWSPYHYSAQTYGLAMMYAYRSDCSLTDDQKRMVWWACLVPFLWSLLRPDAGVAPILHGLGFRSVPTFEQVRWYTSLLLSAAALATPVFVILRLRLRAGVTLPLISVMIVMTNAIWWTFFNYINAMWWAAIFHGVQYLAIVTIFHVKERTRVEANRFGVVSHAVMFYGACVVLAYVLFVLWPNMYVHAGFDPSLTPQLAVAVINIHHFIVDAYIWRLRKDPNYRTVVDTRPEPALRGGD